MILCDIGNTTFHFLINGKHKKYFLDEEIPKFPKSEGDIFFISVNDKGSKKLLKKNPHSCDISSFVKFETQYQGMGIDRVVACCFCEDAIIVDAGSAITVDIIDEKVHKGGFILLGLQSLINTYSKISKKLKIGFKKKSEKNNINLDRIPLSTKDAIQYAIMKSIVLPIIEVSLNKKIIFTGGDGEFLSKYFDNSQYKKDLIFENMKRIIDANDCFAKR